MTAMHLNQLLADERNADLLRTAERERTARTSRRAGRRRGLLALAALIAQTRVA